MITDRGGVTSPVIIAEAGKRGRPASWNSSPLLSFVKRGVSIVIGEL